MQNNKWPIGQVVPPKVSQSIELAVLINTQFSPTADCPHSADDIMCCGEFQRCRLAVATRAIHREQELTDDMDYHVSILEGEALERVLAVA